MVVKTLLSTILLFTIGLPGAAQDESKTKPTELDVLKDSTGVWDAEIETWPQGLDASSIKFKGVETNRAYGEHWISSDFDSEFMGQEIRIHSIVGYDLDKKKLVGTVIDHGPYSATMVGEYDQKSKTVTWETKVKDLSGNPLIQRTSITQKSPSERILVLSMPGKNKKEFTKFMEIKFVKRK